MEQRNSIWFMKPEDKANYSKAMTVFDTNQSGTLTDTEMQQALVKTKMEKSVCAKVWNLSNPQLLNTFTKPMFFIAMHLMYKKKQDPNLELPDQLPIELAVSAEEDQP